ncbi:MAG: hypothetical protein LBK13_00655 [Spirochaetales bacterium]|jgi:hypothetical protein|nr:hypothetical protein [Spirochaetales bacterium]
MFFYDYKVYSAAKEFGRLCGASRHKPGFPLQSLARQQNQAPQLPLAIAGADNCQRQLSAYNHAVAICEANCVICHQARSEAECTSLSPTGCQRQLKTRSLHGLRRGIKSRTRFYAAPPYTALPETGIAYKEQT